MKKFLRRGRIWLVAASLGGTPLVLEGCDANVRDTVLTGVEGASTTLFTTFIQAFFQSLTEEEDPNSVTTI